MLVETALTLMSPDMPTPAPPLRDETFSPHPLILTALAGLCGATAIAALAASAHISGAQNDRDHLHLAGELLLAHAPSLIALALCLENRLLPAYAKMIGYSMAIGATLFAGDMISRAFMATTLFPMAAPIGGSILILSWLMIMLTAAHRLVKRVSSKKT
jgi:uncharacterized membrane protein YgdD (TMEM256/DUF423 family)